MKKPLHRAKGFIAMLIALAMTFPVVSFPWSMEAEANVVGIGSVVRTWGTQFQISSAEEWERAANPDNPAPRIIIDDTIGFAADLGIPAELQRDERGALTLAPGVFSATFETVPFSMPDFDTLLMSWGADTPEGSWIEVWARAGYAPGGNLNNIEWIPTGEMGRTALPQIFNHPESNLNRFDGFLTFGRWSPFSREFPQPNAHGIRRSTSVPGGPEGASLSVGTLFLGAGAGNEGIANVVQLRITLSREDERVESPVVRHVHGSTRNEQVFRYEQTKEFPAAEFPPRVSLPDGTPFPGGQTFPGGNTDVFPTLDDILDYLRTRPIEMDRQGWDRTMGQIDTSVAISPGEGFGIYLQGFPMFSQQARGPVEGGVICSSVTIGIIINGFLAMEGREDLRLMEEIAIQSFDYQFGGYGNWNFTTAMAGTFGLRAYVEHYDRIGFPVIGPADDFSAMETIIRHLLSGHALGLSTQYSTNSMATHYLPRVDGTTGGHLIVILGIVYREGEWYVISYDPWANNPRIANERVYREFPMAHFVNAIRHTGTVIYVVRPGIEPGAGTEVSLPQRIEGYLVEIGVGEFGLSLDGTLEGLKDIGGAPRDLSGNVRFGPTGFIAYTTDPNFDIVGTTHLDPHGDGPTLLRYLPLGNSIRFGFDAHPGPLQEFSYEVLTDPNFRMYIVMGNGFTYVIDSSRIQDPEEWMPELRAQDGLFFVNNFDGIISPRLETLTLGETTIGAIREGLYVVRDGFLGIFPAGTVIESIEDFEFTDELEDDDLLSEGDFVLAFNAAQTQFLIFDIDHFGLGFEHTAVGETMTLNIFEFSDGVNWQPVSNRLTGWDGQGRVVYTLESRSATGAYIVSIPMDATLEDLLDTTVSMTIGTGSEAPTVPTIGRVPIRFVDEDLNLIPYSETGEFMFWRSGLPLGGEVATIIATIESDDPDDPFHGQSRHFNVQILGGAANAGGVRVPLGDETTPSMRWGEFRNPVVGEEAWNVTFSSLAELAGVPILNERNADGVWADRVVTDGVTTAENRRVAPEGVTFPYTPHPDDFPYFMFDGVTWLGRAYAGGINDHTRVQWFRDSTDWDNLLPNGYVFQAGNVYIAEMVFVVQMFPVSLNAIFTPTAASIPTFMDNIYGLPTPGDGVISDIDVMWGSRSLTGTGAQGNWNITFFLTFEPLE